uniref:Rieske domain-containing protein n=1 Tax=Cyanoderma ruficeps TaxID=181631 RepID=A0A8C3NXF0_9PASS
AGGCFQELQLLMDGNVVQRGQIITTRGLAAGRAPQPPAWTAMTRSLKRSAGRTTSGMDSECLGVTVGIWVVLWPPLHLSPRLLEVMVAGYPVLLVRNRKEFSALGSKCPHYGAPLSKGVLRGERLRCPWHGACFNIRTGDIEEYPALDCISCFKVTVEDGKVFITAKKKVLTLPRGVRGLRWASLAGVAALVCAETLRQEGFTGRIVMATSEKHVPYDKSKLSKVCVRQGQDCACLACGPSLLQAVSVDFQKQRVRFMDGSSQKYQQLLIATGSHSGFLQVPGADLQNICTLQTPEDSSKILKLATGKNLVIVGASFIGMEVAAFLSDKAGTISVVEREEFPFQHALGPQVGGVAMKMLQNKGVKFHMKTELCELKGKDGKVSHVFLSIPAHGPALPSHRCTNCLLSHQHMQTNIPNVFAAGDVVTFPVALLDGARSSIRHQQVAEAHGHCAALNMLQGGKELHTVPYFWTTMLGKSIRYAGCGKGYTDTVVKGSLEQQKFLIFYIRDGHVTAAASLNCDPMVSLIAEVFWWVALCSSPCQQSPLRDTKPRGVTANPQPTSCFQGL